MNEAIKLAIEKGRYIFRGVKHNNFDYKRDTVVLDPLFWQALGKALGWIETGKHFRRYEHDDYEECSQCIEYGESSQWIHYAHQYFDLALTGGDTEKFWKELINA